MDTIHRLFAMDFISDFLPICVGRETLPRGTHYSGGSMFRSAVVFAACSVVAFAGCGGPAKNSTVPTVPVNGKLTVDGKPFGSCSITFVPADASPSKKSATAIVAPDGSFSLRTFKDGDGAPEGTYTILLVADAIDPKPIPETKPKTFDVKKPAAGGTLEMTVDLEGTGKSTNPLLPPTP